MVDQQEESAPKGVPSGIAVPERPKPFEIDLSEIERLTETLPTVTPEIKARKYEGGNFWRGDNETQMFRETEYLRRNLLEAVRFTCKRKLGELAGKSVVIGDQTLSAEAVRKAVESGNLRTFLTMASEYQEDLWRVIDQIQTDYPDVLREKSWERLTGGITDFAVREMKESIRRNNILGGIREILSNYFGIEPAKAGSQELLKQEATPLNLRPEIQTLVERDRNSDREPNKEQTARFREGGELAELSIDSGGLIIRTSGLRS